MKENAAITNGRKTRLAVAVCGLCATAVLVATTPGGEAGRAAGPAALQWTDVSEPVLAKLEADGQKTAWPGKTTGVAVDRTTGDLFMIVTGLGVWKSSDKGATFQRVDQNTVSGRCETGYALCTDPGGKRLACFMLDGKSAMTLDGGKTWTPVKNVQRGFDWAAADWSDKDAKTIFGLVHESGGIGIISQDAGKTWNQIGKAYFAVGVFPGGVLVCSKEKGASDKGASDKGILRSTDSGQTWERVSDASPIGTLTVFKGVGYWLSDQGLLASKDQGRTWQKVGELTGASWGPYFGKDDGGNDFVVVDRKGFQQTTDGGKTWKLIAPYPPINKGEFSARGWFLNFAWDPVNRACYVARMGFGTSKCEY